MATSTLRPNGTSSNTGALTGGATAHAVMSDNSDASYVTFDPGEEAALGLDDFALPSGAVLRSMAVRLRTRVASGGTTAPLLVSLFDNAPGQDETFYSSVVNWVTETTTTIVTLTPPSGYLPAINDAVLTVGVDNYGSAARVLEAYVDVVYVPLPVATILTPSGTVTDDDTPTVTWSMT